MEALKLCDEAPYTEGERGAYEAAKQDCIALLPAHWEVELSIGKTDNPVLLLGNFAALNYEIGQADAKGNTIPKAWVDERQRAYDKIKAALQPPAPCPISRERLEQMQAHVDEGGKLNCDQELLNCIAALSGTGG
jgi:hypothetical protein